MSNPQFLEVITSTNPRNKVVNTQEVIYIQATLHQCLLMLSSGSSLIVENSFAQLEQKLTETKQPHFVSITTDSGSSLLLNVKRIVDFQAMSNNEHQTVIRIDTGRANMQLIKSQDAYEDLKAKLANIDTLL